eukprot:scaffold105445_cov43-Attheya_sp.AAC.1
MTTRRKLIQPRHEHRRQEAINDDGSIMMMIAVVSKKKGNPFFEQVLKGCEEKVERLNRERIQAGQEVILQCQEYSLEETDAEAQVDILRQLAVRTDVAGIAVSAIDADILTPAINEIVAQNRISLVTFDSDAPDSDRQVYIGTNNFEMGSRLARLLQQLKPTGGYFGLLSDTTPNLQDREAGFRSNITSNWKEISFSPQNVNDDTAQSLTIMHEYVSFHPDIDAIIPMGGWPMVDKDGWINFVNSNPNLTLVCADSVSAQIELLLIGKVNALVGQEPFRMGSNLASVLSDMYSGKPPTEEVILGKFLLEMVYAPVQKPDLNVNGNGLGPLKAVGFVSFSIVATLALACIYWTYSKRNIRVVKASQPLFLIMIATGVLIMSGALIPLSLPDSSNQQFQNNSCMATPWLLVLGFSCTFAALFSKTWRINQIFNCPDGNYARVVVKETDVLIPFCALMTTNIIIMALWTALNPLVNTINSKAGTDLWGRTISTYYACEPVNEDGAWVFLVPLGLINIGVLLVAFWQSFRARSITSEFSETRYINLVMMSLSQAFLTGLPILFLVREQPKAFYLIWVFLILVVCLSVLLLIFVPKILFERKFKKLRASEQNAVFQGAIETSTGAKKKRIRRQRRNHQASTTTKHQQQNNELTSSQLGEKADPIDTNGNQVELSAVEKEDEENLTQKEAISEYHDEPEDGVPCEEGKGDNHNQQTLVT